MKQKMKLNLNLKIKPFLFVLLCIAILSLAGCGENTTPYETNDKEGYNVSVKFDANGGTFTTNTTVIVDSFNTEGKTSIALIAPDDKARDNDAFTATKNGHFLAGWYKQRIETTDDNGNTVYTYADKWDFENDVLEIEQGKQYSSKEPALTLYAAWVPMFEIEFYSIDNEELVDTYAFDPTVNTEFKLPVWDEETGAIEMYDFPKREGYTFNKAYFDNEGNQPVDTTELTHPGNINYETGSAENSVLKLYVDYTEGEWYRIYNAEQFAESASLDGNYEILADLDFADEIWPTAFMYGNFTGTINGNGHTIKNVDFIQTNNSKVNAGLFGNITESAQISDLNFENITFTIKSGTRVVGTSYGLFAGTISGDATIESVSIKNSALQISSSCYFGVDDYAIGLVCGMGDASVVSGADIKCIAVGDKPEIVKISTSGNTITVEFSDE